MRYVGKSPPGGALDREMYEMIMMSVMTAQEGCGDDVGHVVTLRVYYETQVKKRSSFPASQTAGWIS
jgi:hypothetical protein